MMRGGLLAIDWGLLLPVMVLVLLGLTTLFSINIELFRNQLLFLIFSIFVFFFFSHVDYKAIKLYALAFYIISIVLLVLLFFFGVESRGATRWFYIFGVSIQSSEIIKPFLLLSLSSYLSTKERSFQTLIILLILLLPIVFLIYKQPDLGNAIIYIFVTILVVVVSSFPLWWFAAGLVLSFIVSPFFWGLLHEYQRERVITFFYPTKDPLGTSYNAIQSIIAIGSGMILGRGMNQGTQSTLKFLPERHTDFIFATISENLGFIGSLIIVFSFSFLLIRIFLLYTKADDSFSKLFTASSFFLILVQMFSNIGMNVGYLPIVGVALPFVSYGGSSLLSHFILLGILSSMNKTESDKNVLEIGRRI